MARIQISTLDLVKEGDWLEVPNYGANGDVINMTLHTIKVQNWNKAISVILTYKMTEVAYKNWRGMQESGGRRIKRALSIDMSTNTFCNSGMLEELHKTDLIHDYLVKKTQEGMSFLVRTLSSSPTGFPLKVYVFAKNAAWDEYEAIQAETFDHLLAAASNFELRAFQEPTGMDFVTFASSAAINRQN